MANLADLIAQRAALENQIQELSQSHRAGAIEQVRALMTENGLTVADLGLAAKGGSKRGPKPKSASSKPALIKYRDTSGNQWSGRGLKPRWLSAAIAKGKALADFAV